MTDEAPADVVIQTSHQSQCYRIVQFHQDRSLHAFPPALGNEALELGPRSNKAGPCLVLLKGITANLTQFLSWYSTADLRRYCPRVFWLGHHSPSACTQEDLLTSICSAGVTLGILRLQCYPRSLESWLGERLPDSCNLDPKHFDHVLNVVAIDGRFHWNVHEADSTYRQTVLLTQPSLREVSSAVHKLQEALAVLGHKQGCEEAAIDLGAAPGGWSYHLAKQIRMVIAVDPAELSSELLLPNVHHIKLKSELAGKHVAALLGCGKADMLVADMNQHPDTTVEAIKPLLPFVRPGGNIIMTMKFYGIGRDRAAVHARITAAFGDMIDGSTAKAVWLMANTVNERTFVAQRSHCC